MKRKLFTRSRIALGLAAAGAATVLTAAPSNAASTTHECSRDGYGWVDVTSFYAAALPYYSPPQTFICLMHPSDVYSNSVSVLQFALKKCHGYNIVQDGFFGAKTTAALKSFQKSRGLTADGIYGPNTAKAMGTWPTEGNSGNGAEGPCLTVPASKIK